MSTPAEKGFALLKSLVSDHEPGCDETDRHSRCRRCLAMEAAEMRDGIAELRAHVRAVDALLQPVPAERWFPIQRSHRYKKAHPTRVPWSVADKAFAVYSARHGLSQSLERLAERGGFGPEEMDDYHPRWIEEASEIGVLRMAVAAAAAGADQAEKDVQHLLGVVAELDKLHTASESRAAALETATDASAGATLIAAERRRQTDDEGWSAAHDDEHDLGQLSDAGKAYAGVASAQMRGAQPHEFTADIMISEGEWPFEEGWWKPSEDPIRNLARAGALIAAEIDRLLRKRAREAA